MVHGSCGHMIPESMSFGLPMYCCRFGLLRAKFSPPYFTGR
ncbi:hypothetical protein T11_5329 [Trichinella zimbabwensis]|uniref:Uncharacterized protein n=1 Tax=Trichinella zimbabwensis TaxID=268475 RepID=A0A0V1I452_9BILA|nr:hypothetical protein T11_5329 [Trichinella zimbabwensis]